MTSAKRSPDPTPATRHAVYRAYDEHGNPVYYGRSVNPFARLATHSQSDTGREWVNLVYRVEIDWFPTLHEAAAAERELTLRDEPAFARQGLLTNWPAPPLRTVPPIDPAPDDDDGESPDMLPIDYRALVLRAAARMDRATWTPTQEYAGYVPLPRTMILRRAASMIPKRRRRGASAKLRQALDALAREPHPRVVEDVYPAPEHPWQQPHTRTYRYVTFATESTDPNL